MTVQWLRLHSTQGVQVQFLVRELGSRMLRGTAKKKKNRGCSLFTSPQTLEISKTVIIVIISILQRRKLGLIEFE